MSSDDKVDLLDPAMFANGPPHAIFDRLRAEFPVYGQPNPSGKGTIFSLTRYDDIREVSRNVEVFSSRPLPVFTQNAAHATAMAEQMGGSILFSDPPAHTRLRGFAAKAFSPPVVRQFEGWVRDLCVGIADRVSATDGEFDAVAYVSSALPGQVISSILGVPEEDREWIVGIVLRAFSEFDEEIGPEGQRDAVAQLFDYALRLRELKRRHPGEDMATALAATDGDAKPLSDTEYIQMIHTLASAGFETTHTLIAQSLVMMACDGEIRNALDTTDRQRLSPAVDELLRLITPTMYFGRNVTRDTEIRGMPAAKGDFVMLWFVAANRDPAVFEEPHAFKVDRARRNHFAFGAGSPHFCIGNYLAKLEVELLYQEFANRRLSLRLAGEPTRLPGLMVNGLRKLPMVVLRT